MRIIASRQDGHGTKPNIILIVGDDVGWGDLGVYGGGLNRGIPTPNLDRLADEGMTFFSFHEQPSCTPGRAAIMTGRIPNRRGMTTVSFQGQGGGLPHGEWTLASVLKQANYSTFFVGKWHLGEADYALPNAQGFDIMKYCGLYHLNAYTYADPQVVSGHESRAEGIVREGDDGNVIGQCREKPKEDFKLNEEYENTPKKGMVGIPYVDEYIEKAAMDYLNNLTKGGQPFFMDVNFMKVHQPNLPHPDYIGKSLLKSKYGDSLVELDARVGYIMDKVRELGIANNTLVIFTTDNGA